MGQNSYSHKNRWVDATRAVCPVCRQSVYSSAGIHPQCAVRRAESLAPKPKAPAGPLPEAVVTVKAAAK